MPRTRSLRARSALARLALFVPALAACGADGRAITPPAYHGTLTFSRESPTTGPFSPSVVVDYDLATGKLVARFDGLDAFRARTGETTFLARLEPGYVADHGVTVADARGVTAAPLYLCTDFSPSINAICRTPKLSPDGRLVAFAASFGGGSVCKDSNYGTAYAEYVVVRDRKGAELARFEGYSYPEWLPDGRLVMLGTACRGAGVWVADASLRAPARVDGDQVGIPARHPAASPDGKRVAFVWNRQLWMLTLDGRRELTSLTQLDTEVGAAAWSPDGTALAVLLWNVSMPVKALLLMRPGDEASVVRRELPFYPYGPITWR